MEDPPAPAASPAETPPPEVRPAPEAVVPEPARPVDPWWLATLAAAGTVGLVVFNFFGNTVTSYIDTHSSFYWWTSQWTLAGSELEHGALLALVSLWLWWRAGREAGGLEGTTPGFLPTFLAVAGAGAFGVAAMLAGDTQLDGQGLGLTPSQLEANGVIVAVRPWLVWSGLLLFLGALVAVSARLASLPGARGQPAPRAAAAALGGALLLHLGGYLTQLAQVSVVASLMYLWGLAWLWGGARWARRAVFPLVFLGFTLPLPEFIDPLAQFLRAGVIDMAHPLANALGMEVVRTGSQLSNLAGTFTYDVAPACSGVRSLQALAALSLLVGYLSFRQFWVRGLLLALSLPYAFAGNVVRILLIIAGGHLVNEEAGKWVHDNLSGVIFLVVLFLTLGTLGLLQRWLPEAPRAAPAPLPPPLRFARWPVPAALAAALALFAGGAWAIAQRPVGPDTGLRLAANGLDPVALPGVVGRRPDGGARFWGYFAAVSKVERELLPSDTGFSRLVYEDSTRAGPPILLSIVLSGRDRGSIHRPEVCLPSQGWTINGKFQADLPVPAMAGGRLPVTVLQIEHQRPVEGRLQSTPALMVYWFVGPEKVVPTHTERIVQMATDRLLRFRVDRWAYIFAQTETPFRDDPDPLIRAANAEKARLAGLQRIADLLGGALPAFQTAGLAPEAAPAP